MNQLLANLVMQRMGVSPQQFQQMYNQVQTEMQQSGLTPEQYLQQKIQQGVLTQGDITNSIGEIQNLINGQLKGPNPNQSQAYQPNPLKGFMK